MRLPFSVTTLLCASTVPVALAQTVIYTTPAYPVTDPQPGELIQVLENIPFLEQSLLPALSDNPARAEQQAKHAMQQPDWQIQEARLTRAWQALLDAYTLDVKKIPAVVFDNKYVIYGTTDVRRAQQVIDTWREQQP